MNSPLLCVCILVFAMASGIALSESAAADGPSPTGPQFEVEHTLTVGRAPADLSVGFSLLTHGHQQYVAYYDQDRQMTVASRRLDSEEWAYQTLPTKVGWDSHNYVTMAVDSLGHLHVAGNMHNVPLIYFRTQTVGDIHSLQPHGMTGEKESRVTYPRFITDPQGQLVFTYRDGGSGNGRNYYNRYDAHTQTWHRLLDTPLFDGEDENNAYALNPELHKDGYFHTTWVWRNTPDAATNHHLSYARSKDLVHWETAAGQAITLPMTLGMEATWVDPIPMQGGIINGCMSIFIDSENRPLISYHKYDANGHMQIYLARFQSTKWAIYQLTDWDQPIAFGGNGSLAPIGINVGSPRRVRPGVLAINYNHKDFGSGNLFLNEQTLKPTAPIKLRPPFPGELSRLQGAFEGLTIRRAHDLGQPPEQGIKYILQWETLPPNRDKPREPPLPEPGELRLIKLKVNR